MLVCSSACSHPLFLSPDVCRRRRLAPLAQEWRSFRARLVALETEHSGNLFLGDDTAPSDNLPWRLSSFSTPSPPRPSADASPPAASSATRLAPPPWVQAGGHTPAAPAPASSFTSTAASQAAVPSTSAPANNSGASSNREGKHCCCCQHPIFAAACSRRSPACARCRLLPKG